MDEIPATTQIFKPILWNSLTFLVLKTPWPFCKIPWLFPNLEEKSNFPDFSLTSGHPVLCMSSLPASIKKIRSKTTEKRWRHRFPHYKSMGAFCCYGNQSFDPICPKTLCSLSPTPVMLHIKFDQDWPTGFRDIQVWKCGQRTTDHWYTISSPCEPSAQVSWKREFKIASQHFSAFRN